MKAVIIASLLVTMLFTMNIAVAQNLPPSTSLQVIVLPSYSYKADDGTTVVLGEVQNNMASPINAVSIGITFEDDNNNVLEYKTGSTLLQVIPPGGKGVFSISSTKSDPSITQVNVKLAGFRSSSSKDQVLKISPGTLQVSDELLFSGTIKNTGSSESMNTKLYLISYDAFQRVVGIGTSNSLDISTGQESQFSITSPISSRAKTYFVIAESDVYQSKLTDVSSVQITLPVIISNTIATDSQGKPYSSIPVGSPVDIKSKINYLINKSTQPFVYYVQVKQFGGQVEFIGKYEGVFLDSGEQNATVTWTPQAPGSYYIETYVWNSDNIPLSSTGTRINVALVQ